MTKNSGGGRATTNLLRLSGVLYAAAGLYHVLRYLTKDELKIMNVYLTYLGSLILGVGFLLLSFACFKNAGGK